MGTTITDRQRAVAEFRHYLNMAAHHRPRWNSDHTAFVCGNADKHAGWLDLAHQKRIHLMALRYAPSNPLGYIVEHYNRHWGAS